MSGAWPAVAGSLLALTTASLDREFDPWSDVARYEIEYRADLSQLRTKETDRVRVWLPTPAHTRAQTVLSQQIQAPWPHRETRDAYGNRAIYLEHNGAEMNGGQVMMRFVLERSPSNGLRVSAVRSHTPDDPARYLAPNKLIPLQGVIRDVALQQSQGLETKSEKTRAFYDYIVRTMRYNQEGTGWGQGDAVWACGSKRGNCTDFHSLFIGMARSQGIPARFVMGFSVPADQDEGEISGYHCWTEVYDATLGWLPLDATEARKYERSDDYFGQLPSDRIEFTLGRDLVLEPAQEGEPLNYWIYPYAELNGVPLQSIPWTLHFRRLPSSIPHD